jgi:hypothetical protein
MAKPVLLDEVLANLPRRTRQSFADVLPPDILAEVEEIRSEFRAGRINCSKTGLGKAISKSLASRGINAHQGTVTRWLDAR